MDQKFAFVAMMLLVLPSIAAALGKKFFSFLLQFNSIDIRFLETGIGYVEVWRRKEKGNAMSIVRKKYD